MKKDTFIRVRLRNKIPYYATIGGIKMREGKIYEIPRTQWDLVKDVCEIIPSAWAATWKSALNILVPDSMTKAFLILTKLQDLANKCGSNCINVSMQERIGSPRRVGAIYNMLPSLISKLKYVMIPSLNVPSCGFLIDYAGFDYVFDPIPVYKGESLDSWLPEVGTNYRVGGSFKISKATLGDPKSLYVLMRNDNDTAEYNGIWGVKHWVNIINELSRDFKVKLLGLDCDRAFADEVIKAGANIAASKIGNMSFAKTMGELKGSAGLLSVRSGLALAAASIGVRTVIVWPLGDRMPIQMRVSWIKDNENYMPLDISCDLPQAIRNIKKHLKVG